MKTVLIFVATLFCTDMCFSQTFDHNERDTKSYLDSLSLHQLRQIFEPLNPEDVQFFLWTSRANLTEGEELVLDDAESFHGSSFDLTLAIKIVIHGLAKDSGLSLVVGLKEAYFETQDVNLVAVTWQRAQLPLGYTSAIARVKPVGELVAEFVRFLVQNGASLNNIQIVGHSLGAHVAGHAGRSFRERYGLTIPRITGLDPAGPRFEGVGYEERIDASDADFVDIIHTNAGTLLTGGFGIIEPTGHVDFYPNDGSFQPGCQRRDIVFINDILASCPHSRSWKFYAESIKNPTGFLAVRCGFTYESISFCVGDNHAFMGEGVSRSARGIYNLRTNSVPPFALGEFGTNLGSSSN